MPERPEDWPGCRIARLASELGGRIEATYEVGEAHITRLDDFEDDFWVTLGKALALDS